MEQNAIGGGDAGGILAVHAAHQRPPDILIGGVEETHGGVPPGGTDHGFEGHGVVALLVLFVHGHGLGGAVHRDQIGVALLAGGVPAEGQRFGGGFGRGFRSRLRGCRGGRRGLGDDGGDVLRHLGLVAVQPGEHQANGQPQNRQQGQKRQQGAQVFLPLFLAGAMIGLARLVMLHCHKHTSLRSDVGERFLIFPIIAQ